MDGALEELDRVLLLCNKYEITVLLDIHALRYSQNGLDNSGTTGNMEWIGVLSTHGEARYRHWDIRGGDWAGTYNQTSKAYDNIDTENIEHR